MKEFLRIDLDDYLEDMALSRSDAIDKCKGKGIKFIQHFEKIFDNPNHQSVYHWAKEMNSWLNDVKEYKLKESNDYILFGDLRDWFFTAAGTPDEFMKKPTQEKLKQYDRFVNKLSQDLSVQEALKIIGLLK